MFSFPSLRLGRLFGIPLEIDVSWLVIFALVTLSLSTSYFPAIPQAAGAPTWLLVVVGMVSSILFFASVVAHELCHSLVARAEGGTVDKITLFIFGGVAQIDEEPRTPGKEFLMAAAGPAMSLLLALACYFGFVWVATAAGPWWVWAPLQYLSAINLFVGFFNLLPGFPLDGGRVFRSILWAITGDVVKATRWASRSGQLIGWSMVAFAVFGVLQGRTGLIWFGLIGWFIATLAGRAYEQEVVRSRLADVRVSAIMAPSPEYVQGDQSLDQFVNEHLLGRPHSRYPVMHEGAIVGLVTLPDVKSVDRSDWPFTRVLDIADQRLEHLVVDREATVESILPRLAGDRPGALLVVGDGRLVGLVTRSDVLHVLQVDAVAGERD